MQAMPFPTATPQAASNVDSIQVFLRTIAGNTRTLDVGPRNTIESVKQQVSTAICTAMPTCTMAATGTAAIALQ